METRISHSWKVSYREAKDIQLRLRKKVRLKPYKDRLRTITGVDVSFEKEQQRCFAAAVTFSFPDLEKVEELYVVEKLAFPYIPGLLTFREGPAIVNALSRLIIQPDLLMFDGQGIAHPKRIGIASHMGVLYSMPTIGCAKSRLCGVYDPPNRTKGSFAYLYSKDGEKLGVVLRTRGGVKPLFVSPGHLIDIQGAMDIVLACAVKYRLPEPTRIADKLSKKARKLLA
jgi:deoxyribonuclease V